MDQKQQSFAGRLRIFFNICCGYKRQLNFLDFKNYRKLRRAGNNCSDYIEIARKLCLVELNLPNNKFWGILPRSYGANLDLVLRQKIISTTLYSHILPILMHNACSKQPVTVPLPNYWRNWLVRNGIPISKYASRWMSFAYQIRCAYLGIRKSAKLIHESYRHNGIAVKNYSVLINTPPNCLPNLNGNQVSGKGFINWFRNSTLYNLHDEIIVHNDNFMPRELDNSFRLASNFYPFLENNTQRLTFIFRCTSIISIALVRAVFGAWWILPLLDEAILLAYFETIKTSQIAKSYIFNSSNWILRPLWTYYAERFESNIILVYNSTNMDTFKWNDNTHTPVFPSFESMSWPAYAVWDDQQKSMLCKMNQSKARYEIVGPVDMGDSCETLPTIPKNSIGVFDISIHKIRHSIEFGYVVPYYTAKMASDFLLNCHKAITANGKTMVLKQKRKIENYFHPNYSKTVKQLSKLENVIIVDADISASRIIDSVEATISFPFTSAALVSKNANKPSVYFDSLAMLDPYASNARNLPVLSDVVVLTNWVRKVTATRKLVLGQKK